MFKKLELEDKDSVEQKINLFPPYSDYNFSNLYCYNSEDLIELSLLNDNLVVMFTDYITNEPFFSFIGKNKSLDTTNVLLAEAKKRKLLPYLKLIPEINLSDDLIQESTLEIIEDIDNLDYILSLENISKLSKDHYNKKKQLAIFEKRYPSREIAELDFENKEIQNQIIDTFNQWKISKLKSEDEIRTEFIALTKSIKHSKDLHSYGIGVFIDNQMIGFTIADLGDMNHAYFHFVKASIQYQGIFAALYIYLAQYLYKKGVKYMNIEQDLGIPGLREAKQQWHPISYLKKYTIKFKSP